MSQVITLTAASPAATDPRRERIDALRSERSALLASKPHIPGSKLWSGAAGAGGLVGGATLGAYLADILVKDRGQYGNYMQWGLIGRQMGISMAVGLAGAVAGAALTWHYTKPDGAERERVVQRHQADIATRVALVDRQLAALSDQATG